MLVSWGVRSLRGNPVLCRAGRAVRLGGGGGLWQGPRRLLALHCHPRARTLRFPCFLYFPSVLQLIIHWASGLRKKSVQRRQQALRAQETGKARSRGPTATQAHAEEEPRAVSTPVAFKC